MISLKLNPKRARYFFNLSESFVEDFAFLVTAKSFLAASAALSEERQTTIA